MKPFAVAGRAERLGVDFRRRRTAIQRSGTLQPTTNRKAIHRIMSTSTNTRIVQPYLFFDGRCDEALEFYRKALDAEVTVLFRFKDSPEPSTCAPGSEDKVMHANFRVGETQVMASDGRCGGKPNFEGFALSLSVPTEAEADRFFAARFATNPRQSR